MTKSNLLRMDNIGIVVEDLKASVEFYRELGLELEGEMMTVEGEWVDRIVGLKGVINDVAMMRTPDGHSRLELIQFKNPDVINPGLKAPVNSIGIRRMMFAVRGIDDVVDRLQKRGAEFVGEMVQYDDAYRLCYLRGPDGVIIALAEELAKSSDAGKSTQSSLLRLDNVLIVMEDFEAAKAFFSELGLELEGEPVVEGPTVDSLIGVKNVRATLGIMRTPDGNGRIELDKYHSPGAIRYEPADAPVNTLGIRRIMFAVTDLDDTLSRLEKHGARLVGEVTQYEDMYRLCYLRGPDGIIIALAQPLKPGL